MTIKTFESFVGDHGIENFEFSDPEQDALREQLEDWMRGDARQGREAFDVNDYVLRNLHLYVDGSAGHGQDYNTNMKLIRSLVDDPKALEKQGLKWFVASLAINFEALSKAEIVAVIDEVFAGMGGLVTARICELLRMLVAYD